LLPLLGRETCALIGGAVPAIHPVADESNHVGMASGFWNLLCAMLLDEHLKARRSFAHRLNMKKARQLAPPGPLDG